MNLVFNVFQPPQTFSLFQTPTRIITDITHFFVHRELPKIIIANSHEVKQGTIRLHIKLKARHMRCTNMHDTILIGAPPDFRNTALLAKHNINTIYGVNTLRFLNAISNTSPCIVKRKLNFNTKVSQSNVRKCLCWRCQINRDRIAYR